MANRLFPLREDNKYRKATKRSIDDIQQYLLRKGKLLARDSAWRNKEMLSPEGLRQTQEEKLIRLIEGDILTLLFKNIKKRKKKLKIWKI